MTIGIAQIRAVPKKGDRKANHRQLLELLSTIPRSDDTAGRGVDVVVTPECFLDGYVCTEPEVTPETIRRYAVDPMSSRQVREVASWAATRKVWVILGCMVADREGVHNSALVISREGVLTGRYDKVHLQTHDLKYAPGSSIPIFTSDFGRFGVMICADRRWPETVRSLAVRGAKVIFNPTYGMHDERNFWMMRTRSYESEVFIVFTHPLQSLVTGPRGEVVVNDEGGSAGVTQSLIDLDLVDRVRSSPSGHLKDRRPELYGL